MRIFLVRSRSAGFIFCWSAVGLVFWFALVLSGAVCCASWRDGLFAGIDAPSSKQDPRTSNSVPSFLYRVIGCLLTLCTISRPETSENRAKGVLVWANCGSH